MTKEHEPAKEIELMMPKLCWRGLVYVDWISYIKVRFLPPNGCSRYNNKLHLMVKLQFRSFRGVKYPFIVITPRSTLIAPIRILSMGQILENFIRDTNIGNHTTEQTNEDSSYKIGVATERI